MVDHATATDLHHDAYAVRVIDADKVADARTLVMCTAEASRITDLFKLLGDPTRVRMLYSLAEVGELCVCDLAAVVGAPETSVSHALRLLRTAGVVRSRPSGRIWSTTRWTTPSYRPSSTSLPSTSDTVRPLPRFPRPPSEPGGMHERRAQPRRQRRTCR